MNVVTRAMIGGKHISEKVIRVQHLLAVSPSKVSQCIFSPESGALVCLRDVETLPDVASGCLL